jgi:hypothetical protein
MMMTTKLNLALGAKVEIRSAYTYKRIADGEVTKVCKNWVEVTTPYFARPVRFRTGEKLTGVRIIGGVAEYLNEYIVPKPSTVAG